MGPIGLPEMMALFVLALLLFGPKKLPELGRTLGKALSEFRRAKSELQATLQTHMQEIERETRLESSQSSSQYTYPYEEYNRYDTESKLPEPATPRQLTGEQQAAVEANRESGNPAAFGLPDTVARTSTNGTHVSGEPSSPAEPAHEQQHS